MKNITVAAIAVATVDGMVDANYQRAIRLAEISLAEKPDIILLPEAFAAGYCGDDLRPFGENLHDSPYLQAFRRISADGGCMVATGFLETVPSGVKNSVVIFDRGEIIGVQAKRSLWPDDERPYRDERQLLVPGGNLEIFSSRFGDFATLICYENMLDVNWDEIAGRVSFVLSPYNCEDDPSRHNIYNAIRLGIPSAWANRTGTVYSSTGYRDNPGTAGITDKKGNMITISKPGVEEIVVGTLPI
ncbi:MAG: carbon-nitrogen hydrolase family protein [bacterium]